MTIPLQSLDGAPCPLGIRGMTRLALSQALRELAETSMSLIPTFGEEGLRPGAYSRAARLIGVMHKRVRVLAILNDRILLGADWATIDRHLGLPAGETEKAFAEMERRWLAGDKAPWAPVLAAVDGERPVRAVYQPTVDGYPLDMRNPETLIDDLDRFCQRHVYPPRGDRGPYYERKNQVSGGLPH